ncbi:MAG: T9SS type A sorting domain-containing protein [Melioribacteraceae bacterium]|nr:MAG: T9SS type A sorting domain-containing protein [Melioribacteraceae bacterium]
MKIVLNYPVEIEKLISNVSLLNSSGQTVTLINFSAVEKDDKYVVYFEPAATLNKDAEYNLYINNELKDEFGIPLLDDVSISFKTEPNNSFVGIIVENFEETGKWIKIDSNKATNGIEKEKTYFEKSSEQKISGEYSGKIVYQFNKEKASLKLEKPQAFNISNSGGEAGIWIYGDLSNNLFTVKLINDNSESFDIVIDTLNWSGWKLKKFGLANLASRNIYLKSFGIKRTQNGEEAGEIYFDDLQISKSVVSAEAEESIPNEFTLEQNFPNPFNPTTTISFKIPIQSVVTLEVLNILGQKVRSLIHKENYAAGTWSVEWDGKSDYGEFMPSGVYLYKIRTADFTEVKKMILIK